MTRRIVRLASPSSDSDALRALVRKWRHARAEMALARLAGLDGPPRPAVADHHQVVRDHRGRAA
jgi:hypothetical protein